MQFFAASGSAPQEEHSFQSRSRNVARKIPRQRLKATTLSHRLFSCETDSAVRPHNVHAPSGFCSFSVEPMRQSIVDVHHGSLKLRMVAMSF